MHAILLAKYMHRHHLNNNNLKLIYSIFTQQYQAQPCFMTYWSYRCDNWISLGLEWYTGDTHHTAWYTIVLIIFQRLHLIKYWTT